MPSDLSEAFNECLERIRNGARPQDCLADYPGLRRELEPLLVLARSISEVPAVEPSAEFAQTSRARVVGRLAQYGRQATSWLGGVSGYLETLWRGLQSALAGPARRPSRHAYPNWCTASQMNP